MDEVMNTNKYKTVNEWEEAGGEFYQEILPSKQSRCATTKRRQSQVQDFKIKYWQQSTQKHATHKQSDVQFSKLPDLSEVNTNEELIWEEILQIKYMPINMEQKRSLKNSLNSATKLRMIGFKQFKWKQRKFHQRLRLKWSEWRNKFDLWRLSLKRIEGYFGSGVVSYFHFLRGLFLLNVFTFIVILLFIILPQLVSVQNARNDDDAAAASRIAQLADPSMSPLFYGAYLHQLINFCAASENSTAKDTRLAYNLSVAYVSVHCCCVGVVCALLVCAISCEFKKRLKNGKWQLCQYCNLIFCGWDYCTHHAKFTPVKHRAAFLALQQLLNGKRAQRAKCSRNYMLKRYITRAVVNLSAGLLLVLLCCTTYMLCKYMLQRQLNERFAANATGSVKYASAPRAHNATESNESGAAAVSELMRTIGALGNDVYAFLVELAPYLLMVLLNTLLSMLFNYLRTLEQHTPAIAIRLNVVRNMLLRLTSVLTLLYYMTRHIIPQLQAQTVCWENYMGQQLYNLVIAEFAMQVLLTFAVNLPMSLCASRSTFVATLQMFELPKHMLDIIYVQTLCWLGVFYSPGFPLLVAVVLFVMFYVKKFQCLVNSTLSSAFFPRSRAMAMYTLALFFTYALVLLALLYAMINLRPSVSCGLFAERASIWEAVTVSYAHLPGFIRQTLVCFTTQQFVILCFLMLLLLLYYYHTVADANRNLVEVLRNQLVLEGHDKQFLLNRLSVFLKQYQEKNEV